MKERDYLLKRAEQEIALADRADHEEAARAHSMLAGFYLDRAHRLANRRKRPPDAQASFPISPDPG
jgi:hypothetical protein